MPEWLLGSRIKAQGEEGRGWGAAAAEAGAGAAGPQAGGSLFWIVDDKKTLCCNFRGHGIKL